MSKRKNNPSSKARLGDQLQFLLILLLLVLLMALVALLVWLAGRENTAQPGATAAPTAAPTTATLPPKGETLPQGELFQPLELGSGLVITRLDSYTGAYMEDGTDQVVSNVLMAVLENRSSQALQYAQITLTYPNALAHFSVSTIPAGGKVVLLESSRMAFPEEKPLAFQVENPLFLPELPLYPELFAITVQGSSITVQNVSGQTISGDIYVYYKNTAQGILYGGITYRAKVEGGLTPGQSKTVLAVHYDPSGSAILMVTYVP